MCHECSGVPICRPKISKILLPVSMFVLAFELPIYTSLQTPSHPYITNPKCVWNSECDQKTGKEELCSLKAFFVRRHALQPLWSSLKAPKHLSEYTGKNASKVSRPLDRQAQPRSACGVSKQRSLTSVCFCYSQNSTHHLSMSRVSS